MTRVILALILFLSLSAVAAEPQAIVAALSAEQPEGYQPFSLDAGTEAFVQATVRLSDGRQLVQLRVLDGKCKGALVWALEPKVGQTFLLYHTENGISLQTLRPEEATFVRAKTTFRGVMDLQELARGFDSINAKQQIDCAKGLVNVRAFYPVPGRPGAAQVARRGAKDRLQACPARPETSAGTPCPRTNAIDLGAATKLRSYLKDAGEKMDVDPALMAALIAQESGFDAFAENQNEKTLCKDQRRLKNCSEYGWSKSMAQIGSFLATRYGFDWKEPVPAPLPGCESRESRSSDDCMAALEKHCELKFHKNGKYPIYCPRQSILALATYLHEMTTRERNVDVVVETSAGHREDQQMDLRLVIGQEQDDLLRYLAGEYNRGPRIDDSIEEYFRQNGKAPKYFGYVWATARTAETPTKDIGFQLLNQEYVNRCYVWNVAGLCGDSVPEDSLVGYYRKVLQ